MYREITIYEALKQQNALLIDVRSEEEYDRATIPGAVNIPVLIMRNERRLEPCTTGRPGTRPQAGFETGGAKVAR